VVVDQQEEEEIGAKNLEAQEKALVDKRRLEKVLLGGEIRRCRSANLAQEHYAMTPFAKNKQNSLSANSLYTKNQIQILNCPQNSQPKLDSKSREGTPLSTPLSLSLNKKLRRKVKVE